MSQAKSTVDIVQIRLQYNHITGPSSSSSERREATEGTKYVRMLYLTSHFFGMGSGTLTYMKSGRDEDDDGVPAATLDAKPADQRLDSLENNANESKKAGP
jgi:hypothetical protein